MEPTFHREMAPFLRNLRRMLDNESKTVLRWTTEGNAFEIHDIETLTHVVLPKYFKHSKYSSFQRQLNYFSFRKWTRSRTAVCTFSNPYFLRDKPQLTWRIRRKRSLNETKAAAASSMLTSMPAPGSPLPASMPGQVVYGLKPMPTSPSSPSSPRVVEHHEELPAFDSLDWVDALFPSLEMLSTLGNTESDMTYNSMMKL